MKCDVKTEDKNVKEITKVVEIPAVESPFMDGDISSMEEVDFERCRKIAKSVLKALKILKKGGLSHLDLKVDNILCCEENGKIKFKLADFGFTTYIDDKIFKPEILKTDPKRRGTRGYCAPEIENFGKKLPENYGEKADTFSLGATIYFLYLKDKGEINDASQLKSKINQLKTKNIEQLKLDNEQEKNLLDFVKKCVCSNEDSRLSVKEASKHPFITKKQ